MSNYLQTIDELAACVSARTPFIILDTEERDRAQDALTAVAHELNVEIDFYTDCGQFTELRRGERHSDAAKDPYSFIEEALQRHGERIFAIGDVRFLDADNSYSRKMAGLVRLAAEKKSTLIAVTADPVWAGLNKLGFRLKLDLPNSREREQLLKEFIARNRVKTLPAEKLSQAATVLSGYTALQLATVLNFALRMKGGFTYENLCFVAMQKNKLFGKVASITHVSVGDVHVAGLEGIKEWLSQKEKIFFARKEELEAKRLAPPKGVLLVGVPGCGKSLSARLIAKQWQLPLYRFDIGALFDKYVGESEKNMRLALDYIESVSPCVLWIDEIEKELYTGGESDTAKRILGSFLYWLQEYTGRVFLVATANDVSALPPELFRKGRLSEIFFVDLPNEAERRAAIELYCKLCLEFKPNGEQTEELVACSEGFSFADIESAIKSVAEREFITGKTESYSTLKHAFDETVSIYRSQTELITRTRQWGEHSAVPASKKRR